MAGWKNGTTDALSDVLLRAENDAENTPCCNVKRQREPGSANDLTVPFVYQQYVGLRVIDLDNI
ncbi:hypothetical protein AWV80_26545 [Cupriavidus sp. UYMU48A]|nr:hypothetical protein AWV80_26545 [Cupriavidus sp. UYMU48A]